MEVKKQDRWTKMRIKRRKNKDRDNLTSDQWQMVPLTGSQSLSMADLRQALGLASDEKTCRASTRNVWPTMALFTSSGGNERW